VLWGLVIAPLARDPCDGPALSAQPARQSPNNSEIGAQYLSTPIIFLEPNAFGCELAENRLSKDALALRK
jgi:hypothetical protein